MLATGRDIGYLEGRTALRQEILEATKEFELPIAELSDAECREMLVAMMSSLVASFNKEIDDVGITAEA